MAKVATEQIAPLVRKMDDAHKIEQSVIDALFENGVNLNNATLSYEHVYILCVCS